MNAFRVRHLENCLNQYDRVATITLPLDRYLFTYFKAHPKIQRLDKAWISEQTYELIRWKGLVDHITVSPLAWQTRLKTFYCSQRWKANTQNTNLPGHIRVSFPESLFERIVASLGFNRAIQCCLVLNEAPPRFLRVNVNKTTRDRLYRSFLNKGVPVEKCATSPIGLQLTIQQRLSDLPEYNEGMVEIQDESSQLMAMKVKCEPGEKIMDYCSGGGGKASIFTVPMENQGVVVLHDVNADVLLRAKLRLRNAGISIGRPILAGNESIKQYEGNCHRVVCDVPCTSTGSLRRNPELKWHYTDEWLRKLVQLQREIVMNALKYLRKDGQLVYMTQSILDEENAKQIRYFCLTHGLRLVEEPFHSLPLSRGMDGFFCSILEKAPQLMAIETNSNVKNKLKNKKSSEKVSCIKQDVTCEKKESESACENKEKRNRNQSNWNHPKNTVENEVSNVSPQNTTDSKICAVSTDTKTDLLKQKEEKEKHEKILYDLESIDVEFFSKP